MRILLVGVVATLVGIGGGSLVWGSRLKDDIVKRLEEETGSRTAAARVEASSDVSGGGASNPAAGQGQADTRSDQPAVEEDPVGGGQEPSPPTPGGGESSEPVPVTASLDTALPSTSQSGSAMGGGDPSEQVLTPPATGGGESSEPVPVTASLDTALASTSPSDFAMGGGQGIDPEAARAMAKIIAAMRPEDAAEVLKGMENPEIQAILLNMGNRQAAAILGDLPADKAAALTRLVLLNPTSGG